MSSIKTPTGHSQCKGKAVLWPLGNGIQSLGFALMAGGMLALGAFTAPVVFGHFPRTEAGPAMAVIFRRYDIVLMVTLGLVWLGELFRYCYYRLSWKCPVILVRNALIVLLSGSLFYSTLFLNAEIERYNKAGVHRSGDSVASARFDTLHKRSEGIYKLEMLMVVLLILLTPFARPRAEAG
jgi:hypothetical protein